MLTPPPDTLDDLPPEGSPPVVPPDDIPPREGGEGAPPVSLVVTNKNDPIDTTGYYN